MEQERNRAVDLQQVVRALTPMQTKLVESLRSKYALNGHMSTTELAWRNKTNRLVVSSAMRSLEGQGRAGYFRIGNDQWAAQTWYLKGDLRPNDKLSHAGPTASAAKAD